MEQSVLMAEIGAPQGIKGEVRMRCFAADPSKLKSYGPLHSEDGRIFKIKKMRAAKGGFKGGFIVRFEGIETRDQAESLRHVKLYVHRKALPENTEQDEFYIADLIGLAVLDESGEMLGRVRAVPDFGAGSLLEIAPESGASWYVTFSRENVPHIDFAKGTIIVRPPAQTD